MKGANYQHLTVSANVGLCLCASENQTLKWLAHLCVHARSPMQLKILQN